MGKLQQRKIEQADFATPSLNKPGYSTLSQYRIGVMMPLYEGGMKTAKYEGLAEMAKSKEYMIVFPEEKFRPEGVINSIQA